MKWNEVKWSELLSEVKSRQNGGDAQNVSPFLSEFQWFQYWPTGDRFFLCWHDNFFYHTRSVVDVHRSAHQHRSQPSSLQFATPYGCIWLKAHVYGSCSCSCSSCSWQRRLLRLPIVPHKDNRHTPNTLPTRSFCRTLQTLAPFKNARVTYFAPHTYNFPFPWHLVLLITGKSTPFFLVSSFFFLHFTRFLLPITLANRDIVLRHSFKLPWSPLF